MHKVGNMDSSYTITLDESLPYDIYTLKYMDNCYALADYNDICTLHNGGKYKSFIWQNIAPENAEKIGVYNSTGNYVGYIPLEKDFSFRKSEKLYSFGLIADIHISAENSVEDFSRTLKELSNQGAMSFVCINGDLTDFGRDYEFKMYKEIVDTCTIDIPVFAISGNHDAVADGGYNVKDIISCYTGEPLYYSFQKGNDIFIMVGNVNTVPGKLFLKESLEWLSETLANNAEKRCFLFQHVRPNNCCGNALNLYKNNIWFGEETDFFETLFKKHKNVIFFHAHSHLRFYLQEYEKTANYDNFFGIHSIHIPSLSIPRDIDCEANSDFKIIPQVSEGYIVDVYKNKIVLKGRDFAEGKFLPIAHYCLETFSSAYKS